MSIQDLAVIWDTHTYTHTLLTALCPGLPRWAGTRKVKPIWILLEQQSVSGGGVSWAICKSAPRSRQITTPSPHYSSFLQARCFSCRPTNGVKAVKATGHYLRPDIYFRIFGMYITAGTVFILWNVKVIFMPACCVTRWRSSASGWFQGV